MERQGSMLRNWVNVKMVAQHENKREALLSVGSSAAALASRLWSSSWLAICKFFNCTPKKLTLLLWSHCLLRITGQGSYPSSLNQDPTLSALDLKQTNRKTNKQTTFLWRRFIQKRFCLHAQGFVIHQRWQKEAMKTFLNITSKSSFCFRLGLGHSIHIQGSFPCPLSAPLYGTINTETGTDGLEAIDTSLQKGRSCLISMINSACLHAVYRKEGAGIWRQLRR